MDHVSEHVASHRLVLTASVAASSRLAVGYAWVWRDALQIPLHRSIARDAKELWRRSLGSNDLHKFPSDHGYSDRLQLLLGIDPDRLALLGFVLVVTPGAGIGSLRLEQLAVVETHRRRKIGSCLVDLVISKAEHTGTPVTACVPVALLGFFESLGFRTVAPSTSAHLGRSLVVYDPHVDG